MLIRQLLFALKLTPTGKIIDTYCWVFNEVLFFFESILMFVWKHFTTRKERELLNKSYQNTTMNKLNFFAARLLPRNFFKYFFVFAPIQTLISLKHEKNRTDF